MSVARPLEEALCEAYREQEELYGRALALTRDRPEETWLPEVLVLFEQVAVRDVTIGPVRRQWQQSGARSPALQARIERVAELIRELQAVVESALGRVGARQRALVPELEGMARARRMRQAYGRNLGGMGPGRGSIG